MSLHAFVTAAVGGAIAGLAATLPMTLAMEVMHRRLPIQERGPLPPRKIAMRAAGRVGVRSRMDEGERRTVTLAAHFGFGAAAGALYPPVARRMAFVPPLLRGIGYGLAVWTLSYLGWLPAVGLLGPATREANRRTGLMVAAHVIWGAALGLLFDRLAPPAASARGEPGPARY